MLNSLETPRVHSSSAPTGSDIVDWFHHIEPEFFRTFESLGDYLKLGRGVWQQSGFKDAFTGRALCHLGVAFCTVGLKSAFGDGVDITAKKAYVAASSKDRSSQPKRIFHFWGHAQTEDANLIFDPTRGQNNPEFIGKILVANSIKEPDIYRYQPQPRPATDFCNSPEAVLEYLFTRLPEMDDTFYATAIRLQNNVLRAVCA